MFQVAARSRACVLGASRLAAARSWAARCTASAASPIDRVIRFIGVDGQVYLGEQPNDPDQPVRVLAGSLYDGSIVRTSQSMEIKKLLSPIVPTDLFCIGLNYMKHYEEGAKKRGVPLPDKPPVWLSPSTSLSHPNDDIWMPDIEYGEQLDWECELTIVIGKTCRNVKREEALDYVLGYTTGIDVSCRHWQRNAGASQWTKGKAFDTFKPLGPVLVSANAIPDPQKLQLTTRVNGEIQQNESTSDMIFTCAEIIEWLSDNQTLAAGAVIMTGTPEGVAAGRTPPNYLKVGDVLECEVSGIGTLRHSIVHPPK